MKESDQISRRKFLAATVGGGSALLLPPEILGRNGLPRRQKK
jgi:hypothetical protein